MRLAENAVLIDATLPVGRFSIQLADDIIELHDTTLTIHSSAMGRFAGNAPKLCINTFFFGKPRDRSFQPSMNCMP